MSQDFPRRSDAPQGDPDANRASGPEFTATPYGYSTAATPVSGKRQVEEIIDLLFRRRWIILSTFFLVTTATVIYTMRQTPLYTSSSMVMVDLGAPTAPQTPFKAPGTESTLFATSPRSITGELFVIQNSYAIEQRVRERRAQIASERGQLRGGASFESASQYVPAITIRATSPDPEEAKILANLYAEEYVRLTQESNRSYVATSREYLEAQEQERRRELMETEERITRHLTEGKALALDASGAAVVTKISTLESQRDQAMLDLRMRTSALEMIQAELNNISPQLVRRMSSDVAARRDAVRQRLQLVEAERKEILLHYSGLSEAEVAQRNPDILEKDRLIAQLKQEIESLSTQLVEEVRNSGGALVPEEGLARVAELQRQAMQSELEIDGLRAQIDVLNRYLGQSERELASIPEQSLVLARLQREKQHAEQMYNYVVQRLQETRINEESRPGYAHILREAHASPRPVHPDKPRNIILGLFFGLMAGLALAIGRDKLDNRLYKPDDLSGRGFKVIGTIPDMTALIKEDHGNVPFVERDGHRYSTHLVALVNPISTAAETYRQLRTRIQFSRPDKVVQTILITSSSPGEGKTITASNLAVTMAQAGRRTLLIDADLRRPRVHEVWGLKPEKGLVQLLSGKPGVSIDQFRTAVDNLYVLPAGAYSMRDDVPGNTREATSGGPEVSTPSELVGSKAMRDLLETFRDVFDIIVIDTPPVLAASDGILLSTQSDGTILVARAGKTKEGEIETVMEELSSVGAPVLGLLLNGFDVSMAYGRKYRYQHYTKYGPYEKYGYYGSVKSS